MLMSQREEQPGKGGSSILAVDEGAILRQGLTRLADEESNLVVGAEAQSAYQTPDGARQRRIDLEFVSRSQFIHAFQIAYLRETQACCIQRGRSETKKGKKRLFFKKLSCPLCCRSHNYWSERSEIMVRSIEKHAAFCAARPKCGSRRSFQTARWRSMGASTENVQCQTNGKSIYLKGDES